MTKTELDIYKYQPIHEFNKMIARAHKRGQTQADIARHLGVGVSGARRRIVFGGHRPIAPIERYFAECPVEGMNQKSIRILFRYVEQIAEAIQ